MSPFSQYVSPAVVGKNKSRTLFGFPLSFQAVCMTVKSIYYPLCTYMGLCFCVVFVVFWPRSTWMCSNGFPPLWSSTKRLWCPAFPSSTCVTWLWWWDLMFGIYETLVWQMFLSLYFMYWSVNRRTETIFWFRVSFWPWGGPSFWIPSLLSVCFQTVHCPASILFTLMCHLYPICTFHSELLYWSSDCKGTEKLELR